MVSKSPEERGLARVAPGHSMSIHTDSTPIALPRRLDLALTEDRIILADCLTANPELAELAKTQLDRYLSLFPESYWRLLYSGGIVVIPAGPRHANAYPLQFLLMITEVLRSMSHYPGFDALLAGFQNPPQVPSVLFEIQAAEWCRTRELTSALHFFPTIIRPKGPKRPDFRWETELGALYCECKQAHEFEAKYRTASERLFRALETAHNRKTWAPGLRLDIWIRLAGPHLEDLLRDLVDTAWHHQYPGPVPWDRDARLLAVVRPSSELPPHSPRPYDLPCVQIRK